MLVLTRKKSQSIVIGDKDIEIKILQIDNNSVRIGIEADRSCPVDRLEVYEARKRMPHSDDNVVDFVASE